MQKSNSHSRRDRAAVKGGIYSPPAVSKRSTTWNGASCPVHQVGIKNIGTCIQWRSLPFLTSTYTTRQPINNGFTPDVLTSFSEVVSLTLHVANTCPQAGMLRVKMEQLSIMWWWPCTAGIGSAHCLAFCWLHQDGCKEERGCEESPSQPKLQVKPSLI